MSSAARKSENISQPAQGLPRHEALRNALASARIEGHEVTSETSALLDSHIEGELEADDIVGRMLARRGPSA